MAMLNVRVVPALPTTTLETTIPPCRMDTVGTAPWSKCCPDSVTTYRFPRMNEPGVMPSRRGPGATVKQPAHRPTPPSPLVKVTPYRPGAASGETTMPTVASVEEVTATAGHA